MTERTVGLGAAGASAVESLAAIRRKTVGSLELLDAYLDRIDGVGRAVNAVVTLDVERARTRAAEADRATARGESWGPLHGLPITVKDCLGTAGLRTTAGAPEFADHVPVRDADAVARLRDAGAIVFGKTNVPAFPADCQTYDPIFGTTSNPWDLSRAVGGSSGGAAAALAAGLTGLELGSDLGGSIRNPAGYCGVYGLRPSFGIVPTRGHIPGPPGSLAAIDTGPVGPLARTAADLGLALAVLAGPDAAHATAWRLELPAPRATPLAGYRVAAWLDDDYCGVDADVLRVLGNAVDAIRGAGTRVDEGARPCTLREAERLAQQIGQAAFRVAYPAETFDRMCRRAASADPDDDSPPVRHARNVTARAPATWPWPASSGRASWPSAPRSSATTTSCCARSRRPRPSRTTTGPRSTHDASSSTAGHGPTAIRSRGRPCPGSAPCRQSPGRADPRRAAGRVAGDRPVPGGPHGDRRGRPDRRPDRAAGPARLVTPQLPCRRPGCCGRPAASAATSRCRRMPIRRRGAWRCSAGAVLDHDVEAHLWSPPTRPLSPTLRQP